MELDQRDELRRRIAELEASRERAKLWQRRMERWTTIALVSLIVLIFGRILFWALLESRRR